MKSLLAVALLTMSLASSKADFIGSALRDASMPGLIQKTIPTLHLVAGDANWNGGMYSSRYTPSASFDSNNTYSIYSSTAENSATELASSVLHSIADQFKLPTTPPSSVWLKQTPSQLSPKDYAMAFLSSYPNGKQPPHGGEYITVEVVKLDKLRYSISVTYVCVKNDQ